MLAKMCNVLPTDLPLEIANNPSAALERNPMIIPYRCHERVATYGTDDDFLDLPLSAGATTNSPRLVRLVSERLDGDAMWENFSVHAEEWDGSVNDLVGVCQALV